MAMSNHARDVDQVRTMHATSMCLGGDVLRREPERTTVRAMRSATLANECCANCSNGVWK